MQDLGAAGGGRGPAALAPRTIGYVALGVAIAAYEQWLETEDADLSDLMDSAVRQVTAAFGGELAPADPGVAKAQAALSA
jgi:TetR/AcrR family transcriptional regulator, regulator of mycofactocin system